MTNRQGLLSALTDPSPHHDDPRRPMGLGRAECVDGQRRTVVDASPVALYSCVEVTTPAGRRGEEIG